MLASNSPSEASHPAQGPWWPSQWGPADERGALNHLGPRQVLAAASLIRKGEVINDGDRMMLSTLVAIMGREAAYTGQRLTWEQIHASTQDLAPEETLKWDDSFEPTPRPIPGVTKFV